MSVDSMSFRGHVRAVAEGADEQLANIMAATKTPAHTTGAHHLPELAAGGAEPDRGPAAAQPPEGARHGAVEAGVYHARTLHRNGAGARYERRPTSVSPVIPYGHG